MSTGKLDATFKLVLRGLTLNASALSQSADRSAQVVLSSEPQGFRLAVSVEGLTKEGATARAQRIADGVYEALLLAFAKSLDESTAPRLEASIFTPADGSANHHTLHATSAHVSLEGAEVAVSLGVSPERLTPLIDRVLLDIQAGQPVVSAMLYSSRRMFRIAMETDDSVASFLIYYSALSLFALFKLGRNQGRRQQAVDALLIAENPLIERRSITRANGKVVVETLHTMARNNFIHAEDRGADPEAAVQAIESQLGDLKSLVAGILNKG
jgi:hypothetical protein